LSRRLDKAQRGNLGDIKPVGSGVDQILTNVPERPPVAGDEL